MLRFTAPLALALALVGAACEGEPPMPDDVTRDQLASLGIQLNQLAMLTDQYTERMAQANDSTCISTHRTYNMEARMIVFGMRLVDSELDAAIVSHGGAAFADITCTLDALTAELDLHEAVACQDATIELDRAEATRHLDVLTTLREHLTARSSEIEAGLESGVATWSLTLASTCP